MDIQNRITGSLVGFACGDALGIYAEFKTPEQIKREYGVLRDMVGGECWLGDIEPGTVTDDTEMMLLVGQSIVWCNGFNADNMATKLKVWYDDDPIDIGRTIRAGLHRYAKSGELERPASHDQAGNGSLMRCLPFALADGQMLATPTSNAIDHAHLTHNNRESDHAIEMYLKLIDIALQGRSMGEMMVALKDRYAYTPYDGKCSGYVVETMNTVLHCFFTTTCFEDALIKCANLGGDADTTSAILGGLAGAYYGFDSIPNRWLEALDPKVMHELMVLADGLVNNER